MQRIIPSLFLLGWSLFSAAQTCFPIPNTFTTQAQIDNFPVNYPGCTTIGHSLTISGAGITNLNGLAQVTTINNSLTISNNPALTSLSGLNALTSVQEIYIENNNSLTSLTGLGALTTFNSYFYIRNNASLLNLTGLSALANIPVNGVLFIENNGSMTSLAGLNAALTCAGWLVISNNDALTSLTGFPAPSIGQTLDISGNDALTTLGGINVAVQGSIIISNNPALLNLNGLSPTTSLSGSCNVQNNKSLVSLSGLNGLVSVAQLFEITNNDALPNLTGLGALTSVGSGSNGHFRIANNDNLTSLSGATALTTVSQFYITNNKLLASFNGLNALTSTGSLLHITGNEKLVSLNGLGALVSTGGELLISNNMRLANLNAFGSLTTVGGSLTIEALALNNLTGFGALTSVNGFLKIQSNTQLQSLSALSNLQSIQGALTVAHNTRLGSLTGLDNINQATITSLTIIGGSNLSFCKVASICNYLAVVPAKPFNIAGNTTGCASKTEVTTVCPTMCTVMSNPLPNTIMVPVTASIGWLPATGATGYLLDVGTSSGGTQILNNFDVGNVTTYDPPGDLPMNSTIFVKIKPYNGVTTETGCHEQKFTVLSTPTCTFIASPPPFTVGNPANEVLSWNPVAGAAGYLLSVGSNPSGDNILNNFDVGNVTSYNPPGDFPAGTIRVKINPYNAAGTASCSQLEFSVIASLANPSVCQLNRNIFDYPCTAGNRFAINVASAPGTQLGTDVVLSQVKLILQHPCDAEMYISLISPNGIRVELTSGNGGSGDNFGDVNDPACAAVTNFTMSAGTSVTAGTAPFIGNYLPEGNFADFNDGSNPVGLWTLEICDIIPNQAGVLQFVELVFTSCSINTYFSDNDGDTFGNANMTTQACTAPSGYVANDDDCNDANAAIYPGAPELCNGLDDDCSGTSEAAMNTWNGSGDGTNWNNPANWSDGIVPLSCQDVVIPAGFTVTVLAGNTAVGKTLDVATGGVLTTDPTGQVHIQN